MADTDGKTEQPTAKRKSKARRDGQVAKSQDLGGWLIMLVGTELIPRLFRTAYGRLTGMFTQISQVIANPEPGAAYHLFDVGLRDGAAIALPNLAILTGVGLAANLAQTRGLVSLHAAAPKFSHLNPLT